MGEHPEISGNTGPSEHESAVFAAELGECVSLDLHGMTVDDAVRGLDTFLNHEFMNQTDVVKIIHGRGEEKLRRAVEKHLAANPLVEYWRSSQSPAQAGAVTYAVLARK